MGNTAIGGEGESLNDVIPTVHAISFRDLTTVISVRDNKYGVMNNLSVTYCILYASLLILGGVMATVGKEIGPTSGP
jgi:hypothetical protein